MMKRFLLSAILVFSGFSVSAFEGVLTYKIRSSDRDWTMKCMVKGDQMKAEVMLGSTHFQSIHRIGEKVMLIDEFNRQVYPIDLNRSSWGQKDFKELKRRKKKSDYERIGPLKIDSFSGYEYEVDGEDGRYIVEVVEDYGQIHGIFLDQFSSLRPIYFSGGLLFEDGKFMPRQIYKKGKKKKPVLELISIEPSMIPDEVYVIPEDYIRAKIKFKMR